MLYLIPRHTFGFPPELHSDQGRNFESRMFKEVYDILKIEDHTIPTKREWSSGTYEPHQFADTPMFYLGVARGLGSTPGYCRYGN